MVIQNILHILSHAAKTSNGNGLLIYSPGSTYDSPIRTTYAMLYEQTVRRAKRLITKTSLKPGQIVLLHVDDHLTGIFWFWAIVAAGGIPCLSTRFSRDLEHRERHIRSLQKLLEQPIIVTTEALSSEFPAYEDLKVFTTATIEDTPKVFDISGRKVAADFETAGPYSLLGFLRGGSDLAALMLTSGSTGESKAVCLTHSQIFASINGKIDLHETTTRDNFLAWTGFDHVANLVEIHLHAMELGATQVHVPPILPVEEPVKLLQKLSDHKISYTFAPNFLLGKLSRALESHLDQATLKLDLSHLRALISGGESNTLETAVTLTAQLRKYNAPDSFIRPGLGLTETCAGAVYSKNCPAYDLSQNTSHCSVGYPTNAIRVRIVRKDDTVAENNEIGLLQISGPCVFEKYYNNPEKTSASFTKDGWFKTGDLALIDSNGKLLLTGRDNDTIIVNGINHYAQAIETAIEGAQIPGVTPSYTLAFSHRPQSSETEGICIVYLPDYPLANDTARAAAEVAISRAVILFCGVRPYKILPLDESILQKSSLGKLSRKTIQQDFQKGKYAAYAVPRENPEQISSAVQEPRTHTEQTIIDIYLGLYPVNSNQINRNSDLFALGVSSIDLLQLQSHLQKALNIPSIPHTALFAHPTIRELAQALDELKQNHVFSPVVVLQPHGDKTPIWFLHSGLGEILIFMNLARYITDRPVYALRARGFDGEPHFTSFEDLISTYHSAIKSKQPEGPYAMAGYAFGGLPAFEIAKRMESQGDEVKFLGIFDQQPFSKDRVRKYDWYRVILLLAAFIGFIGEEHAISSLDEARKFSHDEVLDHIMIQAPDSRVKELGMTREKLDNWAQIAHLMKKLVSDYDPHGKVACMDVFYAVPMPGYGPATNVEDWFSGYISKWDPFVENGAKYHFVEGDHRTIINPPNVLGFQKLFKRILEERGI